MRRVILSYRRESRLCAAQDEREKWSGKEESPRVRGSEEKNWYSALFTRGESLLATLAGFSFLQQCRLSLFFLDCVMLMFFFSAPQSETLALFFFRETTRLFSVEKRVVSICIHRSFIAPKPAESRLFKHTQIFSPPRAKQRRPKKERCLGKIKDSDAQQRRGVNRARRHTRVLRHVQLSIPSPAPASSSVQASWRILRSKNLGRYARVTYLRARAG